MHRGTLDDPDSLSSGRRHPPRVNHDFSDYQGTAQTDLQAVKTIGVALEGSGKPFVITSGTLMLTFLLPPGRLGTEKDVADAGLVAPRIVSENAVIALAERGVRSTVVRLPPSVHREGKSGFVATLIDIVRAKGVSRYIGDGSNR